MVITNQKLITDTHKPKRKEIKHNTRENHQATREETKRRRNELRRSKSMLSADMFYRLCGRKLRKVLLYGFYFLCEVESEVTCQERRGQHSEK